MKKAFVVSFEHLPACMLGCYGHQWIETPNFDRLAALSVVFDQHFANDVATDHSHPWWTGQTIPDALASTKSDQISSLISQLKTQRIQSTILLESDARSSADPEADAQEPFFAEFDQVERISGKNGFKVSEDQTPVAQLMQAALERLPEWMSRSEDQLIWIRSAGVPDLALSPEFFSTLYLDEVLDQGDDEAELPDEISMEGLDPAEIDLTVTEAGADEDLNDEDLGDEDWQELVTVVAELFTHPEEWAELDQQERRMARAVYAGYVTLLDQWLGRFLDQLLEYAETASVLLIVTAAQGGAELLGPVRTVENWGLLEEKTHVPLLIFDSANQQPGTRRQVLTQLADLPVSLLSWAGIPRTQICGTGTNLLDLIHDSSLAPESVIYAASDRAIALRSPDFYYLELREDQQVSPAEALDLEESAKRQLYQKPSDRWDVYELHAQLPDTVAEMSALLNQQREAKSDENLP